MTLQTDGFSTTIVFTEDNSVLFEEISVQPPSVSMGGAIPLTTMGNTAYRTQGPKALKSIGQIQLTVAYDPATYPEIIALAGTNGEITITFPDSSTLVVWGWLEEFTPSSNEEGGRPTADIVIEVSNLNAAVETAPAYAAPPV